MNILEDQRLQIALLAAEYTRKKEAIDTWHMQRLHEICSIAQSMTLRQKFLALCDHFEIDYAHLQKRRSGNDLCLYRHIFCYLLRVDHGYNTIEISRELGRDHSTIVHSTELVQGFINLGSAHCPDEVGIYLEAKQLLAGTEQQSKKHHKASSL